jgi:laminin alpha 1/2
LEIRGGDLRLQVQGHKTKAMNISHKINDGLWHNVQVEQIFGKRKIRIVVKLDKKWKIKDRIPRNNFNGGLYVGGVASNVAIPKKMVISNNHIFLNLVTCVAFQKNELHPFRGCIRSLKINKNLQVVKNNNNIFYNNIGQCFQKVEEGAYFGGDAFAIYSE